MPSLSRQADTEIVPGLRISGGQLDGATTMRQRLVHFILLKERRRERAVRHPRLGVNGECVGPERFRIVPDLALIPGERGEGSHDSNRDRAASHDIERRNEKQSSAGENRERGRRMIGVPIGSDLRPVLNDAKHR